MGRPYCYKQIRRVTKTRRSHSVCYTDGNHTCMMGVAGLAWESKRDTPLRARARLINPPVGSCQAPCNHDYVTISSRSSRLCDDVHGLLDIARVSTLVGLDYVPCIVPWSALHGHSSTSHTETIHIHVRARAPHPPRTAVCHGSITPEVAS